MLKKNISFMLAVCLFLLSLTSCGVSPADCHGHIGEGVCKKCGLDYFRELTNIIQSKAPDGTNTIEAKTDRLDCQITYKSEENSVLIFLIYKDIKDQPVVFLMTMMPSTGSVYGWALSYDDKIANGTFDAKQVFDIVYEPKIESTELPEEAFNDLYTVYSESVSFCADMLYSIIKNNTGNLTIKDLGFINYTPSVR